MPNGQPQDAAMPAYLKLILQIGVPSAIAVYLVYTLSQNVVANTATLVNQSDRLQSQLSQHMATTDSLLLELRRANLIALQACSQAAKNDSQVRACWNAASAVK